MMHSISIKSIFSSDWEYTLANKVMILCGFLFFVLGRHRSHCVLDLLASHDQLFFFSTNFVNEASGPVICMCLILFLRVLSCLFSLCSFFLLWILWFALWLHLPVALSAFSCLMTALTGFGPAVILNGLISRSLITSVYIYLHFGPKRSLSR